MLETILLWTNIASPYLLVLFLIGLVAGITLLALRFTAKFIANAVRAA